MTVPPQWQAELADKRQSVLNSDDFIALPDRFEIHEYAIMERFCHTITDAPIREDLLDAIRGCGAFRRFKACVYRAELHNANRGSACGRKGQFDHPVNKYNKVIEQNPKDAAAYYERAVGHKQLGKREKVIADLQTSLELNPSHEWASKLLKALGAGP